MHVIICIPIGADRPRVVLGPFRDEEDVQTYLESHHMSPRETVSVQRLVKPWED